MPEFIGKTLIILGLGILTLGIIVSLLGKWPGEATGLGWLGKLPGDIFIKRDNFTFYFPLGTSLVISVVGSLLLYFFLKR